MMRGREKFRKLKPLINLLVSFLKLFPKGVRIRMFYSARYTKGNYGKLMRYALLKTIATSVGDNVLIGEGVFFLNPQKAIIGNNVSIHPMSYLECLGGLTIGDDVSIAHSTTIMTTNHGYELTDVPIKEQEVTKAEVIIRNNVWIASKATILSGNVVNEGAIVGAGAVVTKDVPSNTIVAGVPAKVIRRR